MHGYYGTYISDLLKDYKIVIKDRKGIEFNKLNSAKAKLKNELKLSLLFTQFKL